MSVFQVSGAAELNTAMKAARSGDTLLLAGGNYGAVEIASFKYANAYFTSKVTIASRSADDPAIFTGLNLAKVTNITLDGISFEGNGASKPFAVTSVSGVAITNSSFHGATDANGYGAGGGIRVRAATDMTLEGNTFDTMKNAVWIQDVNNLTVRNNDFDDIGFDAMQIGRIRGALIENNSVDMNAIPGLDHKDMIQFYNDDGDYPSSDITIRGNTLTSNQTMTHGIYFGNEIGDATGNLASFHKNVLIENNTIITGQTLGIAGGPTDGLTIRDNVLLQSANMTSSHPNYYPVIMFQDESVNVSITGNITHKTPYVAKGNWQASKDTDATWKISGNTTVPLGTQPDAAAEDPGNGVANDFRFSGLKVIGAVTNRVTTLDFSEGDRIILIDYDQKSIADKSGGNLVYNDALATYARLDSVRDLQEIAHISDMISDSVRDNTLTLTIVQDTGVQHLIIDGIGHEYVDTFNPLLF